MHPFKLKDIFADGLSSDEDSDENMDIDETDGKKAWDDLLKPVLTGIKIPSRTNVKIAKRMAYQLKTPKELLLRRCIRSTRQMLYCSMNVW